MNRKPAKRPPRMFDRVAAILEEARAAVVRTVNTRMVVAYWLIGREIVQEEQGGKRRAAYGNALLEDLSRRLTERCGKGYLVSNLKNFRQFHLVYIDRFPEIRHTVCGELPRRMLQPSEPAKDSNEQFARHCLANAEQHAPPLLHGFAPELSWTHYALLMYDRELCAPDDNPTVGLVLCTDRNDAMVQYTLPQGQKQIFAARYRTALPSEEDLLRLLRKDWDIVVREQRSLYGEFGRETAK